MTLAALNALPDREARRALLRCCGSSRWASAMAGRRPFRSPADLLRAADALWNALPASGWREAFSRHPRIGDIGTLRKKFAASWARGEQAGVLGGQTSERTLRELSEGNDLYEAKFGYIFIVCATGKSAAGMLAALRKRLGNDAGRELVVAAGEQRKITRLRLKKMLGDREDAGDGSGDAPGRRGRHHASAMRTPLLTEEFTAPLLAQLGQVNSSIARSYPGESPARQPVHTVYGGAHIFKSDTAQRLGIAALRSLSDYAPTPAAFSRGLGLARGGKAALNSLVYRRVVDKLKKEPVEDFRIDFEDGYGNRPDAEEDAHARSAAGELVRGMEEGTLPPFIGIRIKPLTEDCKARSIRTLDIVVSTLAAGSGGALPANFVVTLPKVISAGQVTALVRLFEELETRLALPEGSLKLELMVETPQSIIGPRGECALPALVQAAGGRCVAAHFGVYDYTASLNITAAHQSMDHPACDFARHMMKVSLAGTGIWISDGATNVLPVGPCRVAGGGGEGAKRRSGTLTPQQLRENRLSVYRAWQLGYSHIMHSLREGYYQGWDLHPAQIPVRYAAVYRFFLEGLDSASDRLRTFIGKAAQATLIGDVFDDAATGQGLLNYFLRAMNCGAITPGEVKGAGLSLEEIHSRSFLKILQSRKGERP